jgi:hypothetical protein
VAAARCAGLVALLLALALMPRFASAQMSTFNVSVYNQLTESADDSTVYASTSVSDNSILGQCGHSDYVTTCQLISPNGPAGTSTQSGLYANVTASNNEYGGTWTLVGTVQLRCSCAGVVGSGGETACIAHLMQPRNRTESLAADSRPQSRPVDASIVAEARAIVSVSTVLKASVSTTRPPIPPPAALQRPDGSRLQ